MLNEAVKRQYLSSADYFKTNFRWEGKPLGLKFKYVLANYPELTLGCIILAVVAPAICIYRTMNYDNSKYKALEKYRLHFTIVRDDHPDVEEIKKEKEYGRQFFPKF